MRVTLEARQERFVIPGGQAVDGYTINGTSPGPVIRARQGQLVEVTLVNESVADGITLHWHGVDVPNAEDGVAGVTQDAVPVGEEPRYRFVADHAGTYWYHSHQVSHEQVRARAARRRWSSTRPAHRPAAVDAVGAAAPVRRVSAPSTAEPRTSSVDVPAGSTGPGPRGQHRQRAPPPCGPARRSGCSPSTATTSTARRTSTGQRGPASPPAAGSTSRSRRRPTGPRPAAARGPPRWSSGRRGRRRPTRRSRRDAVDLLAYGTPAPLGFDPAHADRTLRLLDRPAARLRRRPARAAGGRSTATSSPTCRCSWSRGRRRAYADRERQRRGAPDAPARPPRGRRCPATA